MDGILISRTCMLRLLFCSLSILSSPLCCLFAQQPEPVVVETPAGLDLAALQQMGLGNHPAIAQARAKVSAAQGNWVQVGLPPNPEFGIDMQQLGSRGLAEQYGVSVSQEIVRGGKLRLNREIACREVVIAERELAIMQQKVQTDIRLTFYQTLIAQHQQTLTSEIVTILHQSLTTARNLFNANEISKADFLQAQIEAENAEILKVNAENRYAGAWRQLAAVVNVRSLSPQPLYGDLETIDQKYDWEPTLHHFFSCSPEILRLQAEIQKNQAVLQRALVEPRPNVNVNGLVNWRDNGIGGLSDGALGVSVPLPLWNRNQGNIQQARAEIAASQQQLEKCQLSIQDRLAPVFERYNNAIQQVERYKDRILPAAKETLEINRKTFAAGEIGFLNLLTAQRSYSQTHLNYLDSQRELRLAEAEIEGWMLKDSLQIP